MSNKVAPRYVRKLDALFEAQNGAATVEEIFDALYDKPRPPSRRLIAMHIGSAMTRYRRFTGKRLEPGLEKYTYVLRGPA